MPLTTPQQTIVDAPQRFKVCIAGRRFGKTHLAIRELCKNAREPNKTVWAIYPSYRQARMVSWKKLKKKLIDLRWAKKINETNLEIELKNGSIIALKGADNYDSLRGAGLSYVIMDEFADCDPEAWYETIRPALADQEGGALFIGTPKGMANWAHDLYTMELEHPDQWRSFQYTTIEGGNVKPEEIEAARATLDSRTFRQEFLATFEEYAGRIYYSFDRLQNVRQPEKPLFHTILLGIDFNVDPMSCVVAIRQGNELYVIDEIQLYSSNTQELVAEVRARYPQSKVIAYPDPASRQRKTSAGGLTDYTILQNAGFEVKAPMAHTAIRDRINAVNSRLCDSTGQRHLFIAPSCKYTIEGLERHTYKEGTSQPDSSSPYIHQMDALGYLVDYLFPVRRETGPYIPKRWGHQLDSGRGLR